MGEVIVKQKKKPIIKVSSSTIEVVHVTNYARFDIVIDLAADSLFIGSDLTVPFHFDPSPQAEVDKIEIYVDGVLNQTRNSNSEADFELSDLDEGDHTLQIKAYVDGVLVEMSGDVSITTSFAMLNAYVDDLAAVYSYRLELTTYNGALAEIRRDSDNAVKSFYPDLNKALSLQSEDGLGNTLGDWVGANSGFLRTRFDQSPNAAHLLQTAENSQFKIIENGVLLLENGKAADSVDGVDDYMEAPNGVIDYDELSVFAVFRSLNTGGRLFDTRGTGAPTSVTGFGYRVNAIASILATSSAGAIITDDIVEENLRLESIFWKADNLSSSSFLRFSHNGGVLEDSINEQTTNGNPANVYIDIKQNKPMRVGTAENQLTQFFSGSFSTLIFLKKDIANDKSFIENNLKQYHGIP